MKTKLIKCAGVRETHTPEGLRLARGETILARKSYATSKWSIRTMVDGAFVLRGQYTRMHAHRKLIAQGVASPWKVQQYADGRDAELARALAGLRALTLPARVRPDSIRDYLPCGASDNKGMRILASLHKRGAFNGELVCVNEHGARVRYWHVWRIEE